MIEKRLLNFSSCKPSLVLRFQALGNETFIKQLEVLSSITKNEEKKIKISAHVSQASGSYFKLSATRPS
jgi:hypothetical protein